MIKEETDNLSQPCKELLAHEEQERNYEVKTYAQAAATQEAFDGLLNNFKATQEVETPIPTKTDNSQVSSDTKTNKPALPAALKNKFQADRVQKL